MSDSRRLLHHLRSNRTKLGMICACFALAMLFWARLIVIADMPRTAIAEPPSVDGPAPRGAPPRETSHNETDVFEGLTETTPNRDPFAVQRAPSATDAVVMASAALRGDLVYTSDMSDLERLRPVFPSVRLLRA